MSEENKTEQEEISTLCVTEHITATYDVASLDPTATWGDSGETREQIEQFEYNHSVEADRVILGADFGDDKDYSESVIVTLGTDGEVTLAPIVNFSETTYSAIEEFAEEEQVEIEYDLIVGTTLDGWIGDPDGDLPFRQSADLKNFKSLTTGQAIIFGRKTLESIGSLLPNRLNVIITSQPLQVDAWLNEPDGRGKEDRRNNAPQPLIVSSFEELKKRLPSLLVEEQKAYIIGGASIYEQALTELNIARISRTLIHTTIAEATLEGGWSRFDIPATHAQIAERGRFEADEKNQYPYTFEDYTKRAKMPKRN